MFEGIEITILLAAAAGAVAGNFLSFVVKRIDAFVRGTSNKVDDAIWFTVREAMQEALEDDEPEYGKDYAHDEPEYEKDYAHDEPEYEKDYAHDDEDDNLPRDL